MKQLLFIHPIGQVVALLCGIINAVTGYTRKSFSIPLHVNFGLLYYFLAVLGAGIAILVTVVFAKVNDVTGMQVHLGIAVLLIILFSTGAITGFGMLQNKNRSPCFIMVHRIANTLSLILFCFQTYSGIVILLTLLQLDI